MKRIGNLYERIIAVENLQLADQKARRGKLRSYGVRRHDKNREANTLALHEALKNKTFKTSKYETFITKTPKSGDISAAVFPRQNRSSRYNEHSRTNMGFGVHDGHVFLHQK